MDYDPTKVEKEEEKCHNLVEDYVPIQIRRTERIRRFKQKHFEMCKKYGITMLSFPRRFDSPEKKKYTMIDFLKDIEKMGKRKKVKFNSWFKEDIKTA